MVQEGPGKFVISGCLDPPPLYNKILTGFLRFVWTSLGSSGGSGVLRTPGPPDQPRRWLPRALLLGRYINGQPPNYFGMHRPCVNDALFMKNKKSVNVNTTLPDFTCFGRTGSLTLTE